VKGKQCVYHGSHGNDSEDASADLTDSIAKVEQTNGETAENDGEVEPAEKGTFIGKEDLGLDTGWKGNSLACG
jgi:hypothetical protein